MKRSKNIVISIAVGVVVLAVVLVINMIGNITRPGTPYTGAEKVVISLDEFVGWKALIYANGGLSTTEGSINAENGICIEYRLINDATVSSDSLISGEISGAGYTVNRYAFLQSKFDEAGIEVIMPFISNYSNGADGIIVDSSITTVNDLVGKKIAVPKFSESQTMIEWLMKNSDLTKDEIKSIRDNMVYFDTAEETGQAFFAGEVDGAATWEPYLTMAASSTDSRILFDTSASTNIVLSGLVFRKDFLEENSDFIVKLIDGALQAASSYKTDIDSVKEMPSFSMMTKDEILEMAMGAALPTWADNVNLLTETAPEMYKTMAEIWTDLGQKATPAKSSTAFTNEYINKLSGKYPVNDVTTFNFSEEGRDAATEVSNSAALLSVTLNIEFEVDSYKIKKSSYAELNEFAKTAKILNGVYIQIEGNTAKVEGDDGIDFSYKRALSVAKYLQMLGVDSNRFIIIGNGDTKPIDTNETEEGKANNRRTEVFFKVIGY